VVRYNEVMPVSTKICNIIHTNFCLHERRQVIFLKIPKDVRFLFSHFSEKNKIVDYLFQNAVMFITVLLLAYVRLSDC
jgi:hypothetical protein